MAREPEDHRGESEDYDEGGGPVKSFLEHLEDLRWTLIKSVSTLLVSMLICMIGSNHIVSVLVWPLQHSWMVTTRTNEMTVLHIGTNYLAKIPPSLLSFPAAGTNRVQSASLVPQLVGTNWVLGILPDAEPFLSPDQVPPKIKNYGPLSSVMVMMKLGLWGGLLLAVPLISFFIAQFVLPALHIHEKKLLYQSVGIGSGLFVAGVVFCYFIITGIALNASVQVSEWLGFGADEWRAEDYINFVVKFLLGMGLSFELPVVILLLVKIGLVNYQQLSAFRSYMVVINLVAAAFITPSGDPFTMLLFAAPLQFLYEVSVFIAWLWDRKARKLNAAAAKV